MAERLSYIVPIGYYDQNGEPKFSGTGFIVNNHLITAAHVVESYLFRGVFAEINKQLFKIGVFNCKHFFTDEQYKKEHYDFAIIPLLGKDIGNPNKKDEDFIVDSPLKLSDVIPQIGDKVCNNFFQEIPKPNYYEENDNVICEFPYKLLPEFAYPRWDNYFTVRHHGKMTHGSSGSPVLIGNKVVGIVTTGLDRENIDEYQLPLDYLNYCDCIRVDVLKNRFPELFE